MTDVEPLLEAAEDKEEETNLAALQLRAMRRKNMEEAAVEVSVQLVPLAFAEK